MIESLAIRYVIIRAIAAVGIEAIKRDYLGVRERIIVIDWEVVTIILGSKWLKCASVAQQKNGFDAEQEENMRPVIHWCSTYLFMLPRIANLTRTRTSTFDSKGSSPFPLPSPPLRLLIAQIFAYRKTRSAMCPISRTTPRSMLMVGRPRKARWRAKSSRKLLAAAQASLRPTSNPATISKPQAKDDQWTNHIALFQEDLESFLLLHCMFFQYSNIHSFQQETRGFITQIWPASPLISDISQSCMHFSVIFIHSCTLGIFRGVF